MKCLFVTTLFIFFYACNDNQNESPSEIASSNAVMNKPFDYDLEYYKSEASQIMNLLGIKIRDSLKHDGKISIIVDESIPYMNAQFGRDGELWANNDYRTRIYKSPIISISKELDMVLKKEYYLNDSFLMRAKSHMVHEMVHYLQETEDTVVGMEAMLKYAQTDERKYISVPIEFEAHAAHSYYWLKYYSPAS